MQKHQKKDFLCNNLYFFCFLEILSLFILENFTEKCRLKALHIFNIYNKMYMYIAENA